MPALWSISIRLIKYITVERSEGELPMIKVNSVLELLADERIFSVEVSESKRIIYFLEECDQNFMILLNKVGLIKLIGELQGIHASMEPPVIRTGC